MSKRFLLVLFLAMQLFSTVAQAAETPSSGSNSDRRIPYKGTGETEVGTSVIRVALGLGLVLIAGVGVVLLLRRYLPASYGGSTGPSVRRIELVEVRRLTPKLTLFLIEVDDARILLAQSGDRIMPMYRTSLANRERSDGATTDT
jgi:flagellar biogenesis protein FliO